MDGQAGDHSANDSPSPAVRISSPEIQADPPPAHSSISAVAGMVTEVVCLLKTGEPLRGLEGMAMDAPSADLDHGGHRGFIRRAYAGGCGRFADFGLTRQLTVLTYFFMEKETPPHPPDNQGKGVARVPRWYWYATILVLLSPTMAVAAIKLSEGLRDTLLGIAGVYGPEELFTGLFFVNAISGPVAAWMIVRKEKKGAFVSNVGTWLILSLGLAIAGAVCTFAGCACGFRID